MSKVMEFGIAIGASITGALTGLAKISNEMGKLKNSTEKLVTASKKLENFDKASKKMIEVSKAYSEASKKLSMLRETQKKAGSSGNLFNEQIKKQERILNDLNKQKERQKHVFGAARSSIEKEGYSLKGYKENLERVNKELETQNKLKKIQAQHDNRVQALDNISAQGDAYLKRGAVAGAMALAPLKIYMDVEESQADLRKMLGDEAQKYYGELRKISDSSPLSQPELFEIAGSLAQSGIAGKEIVEYTEMATKLKVAFDMTTQESGEFLAKTKEQLGLTKEEVFAFADTINYMADNTASSAAQLVDFSQRVGSVAEGINLAKEANIAFGATLISQGVNTEIAATGIKKLYTELSTAGSQKSKATAIQYLGFNPAQLEKDMVTNAEETILKVLERVKSIAPEDQMSVLTDIFGKESINQIMTLANNTDKLRKNIAKAKSDAAAGAVENEYKNRMDTLANSLKQVKNQFMNALADLGLALAPTIRNILDQITPLIQKLAELIKNNPKLAEGIMKAVGAFALFNLGIGGAMKFLPSFLKPTLSLVTTFKKLKAAGGVFKGFSIVFPRLASGFKTFGKVVKFATSGVVKGLLGIVKIIKVVGVAIKAAFIANPIGMIIVAIIAVIAIFVVLYKKCEWFRNGVNAMWAKIVSTAKIAWDWIKIRAITVFNFLKPFIVAWVTFVIGFWKRVGTAAMVVFHFIGIYIKTSINVWKGVFKLFIAFFTGKWHEIPGIVSGIWATIKSGFSAFVEAGKTILNGFFDWFKNKWNDIKNFATSNPISVAVKETWSKVIGGAKVGQNYTGTNSWIGGFTQVAERGAELIKIPGQNPFLAQSKMLLNLPKGTQILNNHQTRNSLRDRISSLKDKVSNFKNSNNSFGGDNITIQVFGGNNNPTDIAKEVKRVLAEMKNKKERVAFG